MLNFYMDRILNGKKTGSPSIPIITVIMPLLMSYVLALYYGRKFPCIVPMIIVSTPVVSWSYYCKGKKALHDASIAFLNLANG